MPPRLNSSYQYARAYKDDDDRWYLEVLAPHRFQNMFDNVPHIVGPGDTLHILAYRFFRGINNAPRFWRAIAEFNDIIDATEKLEVGRIIWIPSIRWLRETYLAPPTEFREILANIGGAS